MSRGCQPQVPAAKWGAFRCGGRCQPGGGPGLGAQGFIPPGYGRLAPWEQCPWASGHLRLSLHLLQVLSVLSDRSQAQPTGDTSPASRHVGEAGLANERSSEKSEVAAPRAWCCGPGSASCCRQDSLCDRKDAATLSSGEKGVASGKEARTRSWEDVGGCSLLSNLGLSTQDRACCLCPRDSQCQR